MTGDSIIRAIAYMYMLSRVKKLLEQEQILTNLLSVYSTENVTRNCVIMTYYPTPNKPTIHFN